MTGRLRLVLAAAVAGLVLLAVPDRRLAAARAAQGAGASGRVVAIGDVHGSDDGFLAVLRAAGLADQDGHWTGGTATVVQTGDLTDRGPGVRRVFDLMRRLGREAAKAGGRVVPVLGNHEVMNLLGELRDVTPAVCASFGGATAGATREEAWQTYTGLVARRARMRRGEKPPGLVRTRDGFRQAYQPGCVEYRLALGPHGELGRWLREQPIAVAVQGTVFMHAGASPLAAPIGLEALNTRARDEMRRYDRFLERLVKANLAAPWFRLEDVLAVAAAEVRWVNAQMAAAKERGQAPDLDGVDLTLTTEAAAILDISTWSLLAGDGPLWYRGYAVADEATLEGPFSALLEHWGADRLVVGHTPSQPFRIRARLNGRLFVIDTGMLTAVYKGVGSALELDAGRATAIYADGTRTVLTPAP